MASPSIGVTIEPSENNVVHFLKCAPPTSGSSQTGYLNLLLRITNTGSQSIHINKIEISVLGSTTDTEPFTTDLTLGAGDAVSWIQAKDYVFAIPWNPMLKIKFFVGDTSQTSFVMRSLVPHASPTPDRSYRFWGAVGDLRPGEFWQVHGTSHLQSASSQLYAYDVGVAVSAPGIAGHHTLFLQGTNGHSNEHFRIWGKPIYAIADGTVTDFRYYFPTNMVPGIVDPAIEKFWARVSDGGMGKDGNGNFFTILSTGGSETVLYAHMQLNTLNPEFLVKGAAVKVGDFLGLAGNSGASGGPHLHIHVNRGNTGSQSWFDDPRPMPLRNAHAVRWASLSSAASTPWVKLNGRGIPTESCAVWPSDAKVVDLKNVFIKHISISAGGQPWVIKSDGKVLTTSERLPRFGLFFDTNPGGTAKEIAVLGEKPYLIWTDDKMRQGLTSGWVPVSGSPSCKHITVDETGGKLWVLSLDNRVLSYKPLTGLWVEHPSAGEAKDICVLKGVPYVIGGDDRIWKSAGQNGWIPLPGDQTGHLIAADEQRDTLWIVRMNGTIWSYKGDGPWKENQGGNLVQDVVVFRGTPYTIRFGDSLWQSIGKFGWVKLNLVEPK